MAALNATATAGGAPAEQGFAREVAADLLDSLYQNLASSQWSAMLVAAVLAVFFWDVTGQVATLTWLGYMAFVATARLRLKYHYARAPRPVDQARWEALFHAGAVASGLGWGSAGLLFFHPELLTEQILLVGAIAGVTAGSVAHLSPSIRAANTFLLLSLLPLIYSYLAHPDASHGLAVLTLAYLLVMMFVVRRAHAYLRDNAQLVHGNRHLLAQLIDHSEVMEEAKAQEETEREMALAVFQAIMPEKALAASNVTYHLSSHSAFNGDLLLLETRPDGRQNVMLGDFTGHGLAASLGAIPVADIFSSMTRKGFPLNVIVKEINRKLYEQLPVNLFCAACLVEIDPLRDRVRVWNGGIPSAYLLSGADGRIKYRFEASHPPLGILPPGSFDDGMLSLQIEQHDQVFMATDGVIEQRNAAGEMFGEQRLERILDQVVEIDALAQLLGRELAAFCAGVGQGDDMTFVAVRAEPGVVSLSRAAEQPDADLAAPDWSLRMVLEPDALRRLDPVPVLNHLVRELNGGAADLTHLELALGELYKNALDHGVLALASEQKHSAEGFDDYYRQREARLAALRSGRISLELVNHPDAEGGVVELRVSDSGAGFDHAGHGAGMAGDLAAHGRGIPLVKALCRELEYSGEGNQARALFQWKASR